MAENNIGAIQVLINTNKEKRRANREMAYELGMELLFNTKALLDALKKKFGPAHLRYKTIADELAGEIMQCGIDYFKAKKDNSGFSESNSLEILNSAKEIGTNSQIIDRIEDNILGIADWVKNQATHESQLKIYDFNKIMLKTAFSFMTCDGNIAPNEIALIQEISEKEDWFGDIDINIELDFLIEVINSMGMGFLKDYLKVLKKAEFNSKQELQLVEVAVKTLYADGKVDYNEIKFFRIFRSMLDVSDDQIRTEFPTLSEEFLESDIFSNAYLGQLFDDYFEKIEIPIFEKLGGKDHIIYVDPEKYRKS